MPTEVATNVHDQVRGEVERLYRNSEPMHMSQNSRSCATAVFEKLELDIVVMEVGVCGGWTRPTCSDQRRLDLQGFLDPLAPPQTILAVPHPSSYRSPAFLNRSDSEGSCPFTVRTTSLA